MGDEEEKEQILQIQEENFEIQEIQCDEEIQLEKSNERPGNHSSDVASHNSDNAQNAMASSKNVQNNNSFEIDNKDVSKNTIPKIEISHRPLKDFSDDNFYRRSGSVDNYESGDSFRQQPIVSYNYMKMYEQLNVKSES